MVNAPAPTRPLTWDLFCRVIDNFGDIGVCWRLARQLAQAGEHVRLVVDDASALGWMAPGRAATPSHPELWAWPGPPDVGDIVVEAFGCELPEALIAAMARRTPAPIWLNLEYLSAEPYVERSHGLPSPQPSGLGKWFFYPGFTERTGGLLREPGLLSAQARFDRAAWLGQRAPQWRPGERVVAIFCYEQAHFAALMATLATPTNHQTHLMLTPGAAQSQFSAWAAMHPGAAQQLKAVNLPYLSQQEFDHLLWAADLNFVRGEDSLVRALWAGRPFVWQAYPQHDGAHHAKVQALLRLLEVPTETQHWWWAWNGMQPRPPHTIEPAAWQAAFLQARARQAAQPDLATQLRAFAVARWAGVAT